MSRSAYHRDYYARTSGRRRKLASDRRQCRRWTAWLIREVLTEPPARLTHVTVPVPYPVRRPILGRRQ